MTIGTKSVLYGAHCFFLHPWFVARAWWRLYGFPWDPRLWVAFFVHDFGYIGKPNLDGVEGEQHPIFGARAMSWLFDVWNRHMAVPCCACLRAPGEAHSSNRYRKLGLCDSPLMLGEWGMFALTHSRYFSKKLGLRPSRLCMADKLSIVMTPAWLYLPMARATGEIREYMVKAHDRATSNEALSDAEKKAITSNSEEEWYRGVQDYMTRWVAEHRDGKADTWTSLNPGSDRVARDKNGVWQ